MMRRCEPSFLETEEATTHSRAASIRILRHGRPEHHDRRLSRISQDGAYGRLAELWIVVAELGDARQVDADFRFRVSPGQMKSGARVPDFTLTAEDGRAVKLSDFSGRLVAVNFLCARGVRCRKFCPRLAASFASMRRKLRAEMSARLVLLSITLNPS